ncbi:flagellin [Paenibacillus sp. D2_2]|uniref:flagellin N-terminal helical domain-containing protein n=1 Tax=Paenibacillus sp. D2_2 TaxID=3073092 RepID=UPI00281554C9|nr:flagellin [Paenibacillus sp. D2_2]WMT40662.1 flagellin [Paenibacillus sp. D2_2]
MIINHNIAALNTHRQLSANTSASSKNLEKLSSGLRINRAGDDAAGLAISEKMRGQIRGLDMASKNAQDGISLIQTAEGALTETHSILQRMRELAVQSATDTNTDKDRANLQKEVDQLAQELTRIGKDTEFNTKKLLDGSFQGTFHIGANEGQNISLTVGDMRSSALGVIGGATVDSTGTVTASATGELSLVKGESYTVRDNGNGKYDLLDSSNKVIAKSTDGLTFTMEKADGSGAGATGKVVFDQKVTSGAVSFDGTGATGKAQFANSGLESGTYTYNAADKTILDSNGKVYAKSADGITFTDVDGKELFTSTVALTDKAEITVGGTDISTASTASKAITTINTALESVSTERSKLGAYQNRLEHTVNNLGASSENLSAAESRIRDVDMAKEMVQFTKNNILTQAAQAMLAQANQQPQGVLQLLR